MMEVTTSWGAAFTVDTDAEPSQGQIDAWAIGMGIRPPAGPVDGCSACESYGKYGPSHWASRGCRSGKRPHCTCNACF